MQLWKTIAHLQEAQLAPPGLGALTIAIPLLQPKSWRIPASIYAVGAPSVLVVIHHPAAQTNDIALEQAGAIPMASRGSAAARSALNLQQHPHAPRRLGHSRV
jgi:hypothetical protein